MRRYLPFIIVGVVALLTVGSGVLLYRAHPPTVLKGGNSANISKADADKLHVRGDRDAQVTLEEFGDFQCPPCGTISSHLDDLVRDYSPRVRLIFRNFPLPVHAHAAQAAYAAEAAGLQGRFWEMHDLLYREQLAWTKAPDVLGLFNAYAGVLGLNLDRFKADMQSPQVKEAVEHEHEQGAKRGVISTPTIFVNDVGVSPQSLNEAGLHAAIDAALKGSASSSPKSK